jgi:hypothetical protein
MQRSPYRDPEERSPEKPRRRTERAEIFVVWSILWLLCALRLLGTAAQQRPLGSLDVVALTVIVFATLACLPRRPR